MLDKERMMQNEDNRTVKILRLRRKTTLPSAAPRDERYPTLDSEGQHRSSWTRTADDSSDESVAKPSRYDIELAIEWAHLGGD